MKKICVKCGSEMLYEDMIWVCKTCLDEVIRTKRQIWEDENKIREDNDNGLGE